MPLGAPSIPAQTRADLVALPASAALDLSAKMVIRKLPTNPLAAEAAHQSQRLLLEITLRVLEVNKWHVYVYM